MALVTQAEAARILGITPQAIGQAVSKGRLKIVLDEKGRKRLDTSTLAEDYRKTTQTRNTTAHRQAAALAAKDPEKKKDLGQAHKVYQRYIDTNKKSKD